MYLVYAHYYLNISSLYQEGSLEEKHDVHLALLSNSSPLNKEKKMYRVSHPQAYSGMEPRDNYLPFA